MINAPSSAHYRRIALLVAAANFMENLDGTVITTALPQMARTFGVAPVDVGVGITGYLLTLAIFIPVSGWIADRFGTRNTFAAAIAVFTVASLLCGMSTTLPTFTVSRVLQGIGGAMMVPVGRLIVLRNTDRADLITAIAYITWPALAAPVLGPPVGGFIATYATWHWIFYLNLPLGIAALVLVWLMVPQVSAAANKALDWPGFLLCGCACALMLYGFELVSRSDADVRFALAVLAASAVLGALSVVQLLRSGDPLLDLSILRIPTFAVTIWGGSLFRLAIGAAPFLLPLMFQVGFGMNAFEAGLLLLALFAGNVAMKPGTSYILYRFGFRATMIATGLVNALLLLACATFTRDMPIALVTIVLFGSGLARSMQFTTINTLAFADVPQARMSHANTLSAMAQQLSMGMGVAVGAVAIRLGHAVADPLGLGSSPAVPFRVAFVIVSLIALAAVVDSTLLARDAGVALRNRK